MNNTITTTNGKKLDVQRINVCNLAFTSNGKRYTYTGQAATTCKAYTLTDGGKLQGVLLVRANLAPLLIVAPFVRKFNLTAHGRRYNVRHLYAQQLHTDGTPVRAHSSKRNKNAKHAAARRAEHAAASMAARLHEGATVHVFDGYGIALS